MSTPLASRYLIRRKLGEGGMAEVVEAVAQGESGFRRRVAIKRLRAGHAEDPSFSRMFLDEARIASGLHHGGIVGVLDYGVVDGTPFQILEFVDGENARTLAMRGKALGHPMPLVVALYVVTEVARALHYAHTSANEDGRAGGIVHRDVKPANFLVSHAGDVKLSDFGIAFATERSERTEAGVAKGTPGYMAPEQRLGGAVDARTDIFSLGCALHALAFDESPLAREGNMERYMRGEALELADSVPADIAKIVQRATRPLPSDRYPSAAAMAEDLGAALATRLRTDAKGELIKWLEQITQPQPAATLDALLMPEALLENEGGSWRMEVTRKEPRGVPTPHAPMSPPAVSEPRSRRWLVAAIVVVALVFAAGFGLRKQSRTSVAESPAVTARTEALASQQPTPTPTPNPTPSPSPNPTPTPTPSPSQRPSPSPSPSLTPSPSNVLGTLAVRGGAYRGATVVIDGHVASFGAPHYFELPIGKHTLELRLDGGAVASGNVEVRPDHSPTQPLTWP